MYSIFLIKHQLPQEDITSVVFPWLQLLLEQIDILSSDPHTHYKLFLSGKEPVIKKYFKELKNHVSVFAKVEALYPKLSSPMGTEGIELIKPFPTYATLCMHTAFLFKITGTCIIIIALARPVQISQSHSIYSPEQTVSMHSLGSSKLVLDAIPLYYQA